MLQWKQILERWHLSYEDIPICRMATIVAQQTSTKICPACLDSIADVRLQWLNLNLTELVTRPDFPYFNVETSDASVAMVDLGGTDTPFITDVLE